MTCDASGKTCHKDKAAALLHTSNLIRRRGVKGGKPYRCEHCGYFHITKSKNKNYAYSLRSTKTIR